MSTKLFLAFAAALLCCACASDPRTAVFGTVAQPGKHAGKCFQARSQRAPDLAEIYC